MQTKSLKTYEYDRMDNGYFKYAKISQKNILTCYVPIYNNAYHIYQRLSRVIRAIQMLIEGIYMEKCAFIRNYGTSYYILDDTNIYISFFI